MRGQALVLLHLPERRATNNGPNFSSPELAEERSFHHQSRIPSRPGLQGTRMLPPPARKEFFLNPLPSKPSSPVNYEMLQVRGPVTKHLRVHQKKSNTFGNAPVLVALLGASPFGWIS